MPRRRDTCRRTYNSSSRFRLLLALVDEVVKALANTGPFELLQLVSVVVDGRADDGRRVPGRTDGRTDDL